MEHHHTATTAPICFTDLSDGSFQIILEQSLKHKGAGNASPDGSC